MWAVSADLILPVSLTCRTQSQRAGRASDGSSARLDNNNNRLVPVAELGPACPRAPCSFFTGFLTLWDVTLSADFALRRSPVPPVRLLLRALFFNFYGQLVTFVGSSLLHDSVTPLPVLSVDHGGSTSATTFGGNRPGFRTLAAAPLVHLAPSPSGVH